MEKKWGYIDFRQPKDDKTRWFLVFFGNNS